ncbi:hypothetical protein [uncultured Methanolobus sp.]|uniref:hypothetical protein n=1 Tax=uncultured Methanolobus sp. TaxID=218300 RepID=UPI002AAB8B3E|nr:hypothetical protein [uncultured Methanolobus sp.]
MYEIISDIEREIEKLGYDQMELEDKLDLKVKNLNNAANEYEKSDILKEIDNLKSDIQDIIDKRNILYHKIF